MVCFVIVVACEFERSWGSTSPKKKKNKKHHIACLINYKRFLQTFTDWLDVLPKSFHFQGNLGRHGCSVCVHVGPSCQDHGTPASAVFHRDCGWSQRPSCRLCGVPSVRARGCVGPRQRPSLTGMFARSLSLSWNESVFMKMCCKCCFSFTSLKPGHFSPF